MPEVERLGSALLSKLDPLTLGIVVYPARALALEASRGATDFGLYFIYFSFFLVVSALLLASLFFRLGVEQRFKEIGLLKSCGFPPSPIRILFWSEAFVLALTGSLVGVLGAIAYGELIMLGLRTWWVDAVGTTRLTLHMSEMSLGGGAVCGVLVAFGTIAWTLRSISPISPRSLLSGNLSEVTLGGEVTSLSANRHSRVAFVLGNGLGSTGSIAGFGCLIGVLGNNCGILFWWFGALVLHAGIRVGVALWSS